MMGTAPHPKLQPLQHQKWHEWWGGGGGGGGVGGGAREGAWRTNECNLFGISTFFIKC